MCRILGHLKWLQYWEYSGLLFILGRGSKSCKPHPWASKGFENSTKQSTSLGSNEVIWQQNLHAASLGICRSEVVALTVLKIVWPLIFRIWAMSAPNLCFNDWMEWTFPTPVLSKRVKPYFRARGRNLKIFTCYEKSLSLTPRKMSPSSYGD